MLRLALTPRWLIAALVVALLVAATVLLGRWQWDRTMSIRSAERASAAAAVPVLEVLPDVEATDVPAESIGRHVTAAGTYDPAMQVAVVNRAGDGGRGVWIVSGLRLSSGSVAAVLRGWLPSADDPAAAPPSGQVTVAGILQPDEAFYADAASAAGTVVAIDHDRLAELWGAPVLPGFVVLESQEPAVAPAPHAVEATVKPGDVGFPLQNLFYAFQWWIFGAFTVVVFIRWLWLESRRESS